jgi:intein-encoded DNA endonuclease-like protein
MKRKEYNEKYFEQIDSEEKAYFLGLICADGNITNNSEIHRYQISLKLHIKDLHILNSFIKSIDGEMCVWFHKHQEIGEVKISGKKIINDIGKLGVIPNKSLVIKYPIIEEKFERHFLRGYFDGDGCIRISTDKRDNSKRGDLRIVSGSMEILNMINQRFRFLFGTSLNKVYGSKNKNYGFIGWAGMSDIEKIYYGFYEGSNFFLTRKKLIFDNVIEIIRNKEKYRKK